MDVRLVAPSSSNNDVDVSEFLSLTNPSQTPPLMHTLQPVLPNGTSVEADLGILSNDLEAMSAVDTSKPGGYDLLTSSGVTEVYSTSSGQEVGFVSNQPILGSAAEISLSSMSAVNLPSDTSQYYIQCTSENSRKLGCTDDSGSNFGQLNLSAVATMPSQVPSSSPHRTADLLAVPNNFVLPSTQTFGNFQAAGVIDMSTPPKKPLSPYMRFSKGIWQKVKSANPSMSVCEVGATIGRMWREMSDFNKQQFNQDFALDKLRYDNEMQQYLIANGLQASDLSKSKKKKDGKEKASAVSTAASTAPTQPMVALTPEQMAEEMARTILESAGICADPATLSSLAGDTSMGDEQLPSFSQVWSGTDTVAPAQLCLSNDQSFCGTGTAVPLSNVPAATSQATALSSFPGNGQMFANGDVVSNQLLAAGDDATSWLWQQCTGDNQTNHTAGDAASLTNVSSLNDFIMTMDSQLEPGEVRPTVSMSSHSSNLADTGLSATWPGMGRDAAELALLRNALVARGKEAARLTRELELAYKLIEQLQQQNIAYQQLEWNFQQAATEQMQQQQIENNVGFIVSNGIN